MPIPLLALLFAPPPKRPKWISYEGKYCGPKGCAHFIVYNPAAFKAGARWGWTSCRCFRSDCEVWPQRGRCQDPTKIVQGDSASYDGALTAARNQAKRLAGLKVTWS